MHYTSRIKDPLTTVLQVYATSNFPDSLYLPSISVIYFYTINNIIHIFFCYYSNPPQIITQDDVTLNINIEQLVQLAPRHQIDELQGALPLTVELVVDRGMLTVIDITR